MFDRINRSFDRIDGSLDRIERRMKILRWMLLILAVTLMAKLAFT